MPDPQTTKATPFEELFSMCMFAIDRGDIDLLKNLIEDDTQAFREWKEWSATNKQYGVHA